MVDIFFDAYEKKLLDQIAAFSITQQGREVFSYNAFTSHPEGILELAVEKEIRIAKALYFILSADSMRDIGHRLKALERLCGDIFSVKSGLRKNAARVLIEIMKALLSEIRSDNERRQLELLRDFRETFSGKPEIVRRQLEIYQLLEIPEDESQLTFDDTVNNSSKLNKKNPTHLILDAWIKGVRRLQIIYGYYVKPETVREILTAAEIFDVEVEIGIEYPLFHYGKFIRFVWNPVGFYTADSYLRFLSSEPVKKIQDKGREICGFHQEKICALLQLFNKQVRQKLIADYGISLTKLSVVDYNAFLAGEDACEVNLSEYIYTEIMLQNIDYRAGSMITEDKGSLERTKNQLIPEFILLNCLNPLLQEVDDDSERCRTHGSMADSMKNLIKTLNNTGCAYNMTLLTSNIEPWEVPELLYKSKGCISAVEIFNLRDYTLAEQGARQYGHAQINSFRKALNTGRVSRIKKKLTLFISTVKSSELEHKEKLIENLEKVRKNIGKLLVRYAKKHIDAAIGSGSAGRGKVFYGMGFVVEQSLPRSARKVLRQAGKEEHLALPLGCQVFRQVKYLSGGRGVKTFRRRLLAWKNRDHLWLRQKVKEVENSLEGNIYTLSGRFGERQQQRKFGRWGYLYNYINTDIKNICKVLIGFIPAFLTFYFVADWWVLKYGGGLIWFLITGGRNLLQALLAAGALNKSALVGWQSFVDKKRIAESLMFTGLSVPLLEYLVKNIFLANILGVNAGEDPVTVYAVMSAVNGVYISLHNIYRGFPLLAVVGNLFRSVLAVPASLVLSLLLGESLSLIGVVGVGVIITNWSAVISKTASDTVACLIEGFADRGRYFSLARRVMEELEHKFFSVCERIELLFPKKSIQDVLSGAVLSEEHPSYKTRKLDSELILWLLDLMYFWSHKPRSQETIRDYLGKLNASEKKVWCGALAALGNKKQVEKIIAELGESRKQKVEVFFKKYSRSFIADMKEMLHK